MTSDNLIFLENFEWFDESGTQLIHRMPEKGSGEIKWGAQLTVRESQTAVFFYKGKAIEAFSAGRHTLKTGNIPFLNKIMSVPWALKSPLRAEVYFVNLITFTNLKWGTRDPVAFKDSELGLIRLRAFGVFNIQVRQPVLFINRMAGTQGIYTTGEIEEYLNRVIVSRFNDIMGKNIDSILTLPAQYDDLSTALIERLQKDFSDFGLHLTHLYINSVTPPPEVQQAMDDRSRMEVFKDMNKFMQMKAAMAMEAAAESEGGMTGDAMGAGLGLMMPAMFAQYFAGTGIGPAAQGGKAALPGITACHECGGAIPQEAKFCPLCGHQQLVFTRCANCSKNLAPNAKFCSRCGHRADEKPDPWTCKQCGEENLAEAIYCNQCGEKNQAQGE